MTESKYAAQAEGWTEGAYADSEAYLAHRAELTVSLGVHLQPGDVVLDLACGDGAFAEHLEQLSYLGVDSSPEMVEAAKRRGRNVVLGDLNDYEPPQRVAATTCFRAIYYAEDRPAFFRRAAGYTERKLIFDLNPRQYAVGQIRAELRAAGFDQLAMRPFFSPQRLALPKPVPALLRGLERTPLARLLLAFRFSYLCAAVRGGKNT